MGLNAALAVAGRSLEVFTAGIQVAGQNISNATTPGYIREELVLQTAIPYENGGLVFGTGANVAGIKQQIDKYLETRIHAANSELNTSAARETIFKQLENQIRELGDGDLSSSLSSFLATINDVVNQPESASLRQIVVDQGGRFAQDIANLRSRIDDIRRAQSVSIDSLVSEANSLIHKIADLNPQIATLEKGGLTGSEAGAAQPERYDALNRLSEILPITYRETEDGKVDVFTTDNYLVLGSTTQELESFKSVDRGVQVTNVRLATTKSVISEVATGGELRGIIEGRDQILGGFVDNLDKLAQGVIQEVNRIHTSGEGVEGFQSVTAYNAVQDTTASLDSAAAGLKFPPQHGSFQIKVTNKLTGLTETTTVNVDLDGIGTDTTLESLRAAIDGISNVSAEHHHDEQIENRRRPEFRNPFRQRQQRRAGGAGNQHVFHRLRFRIDRCEPRAGGKRQSAGDRTGGRAVRFQQRAATRRLQPQPAVVVERREHRRFLQPDGLRGGAGVGVRNGRHRRSAVVSGLAAEPARTVFRRERRRRGNQDAPVPARLRRRRTSHQHRG